MRGTPDHVSNAARELIASEAHRAQKERMDEQLMARLRAIDPRDAEACRVIVIQIQEHEAYFTGLERMVTEQDQREIRTVREVV